MFWNRVVVAHHFHLQKTDHIYYMELMAVSGYKFMPQLQVFPPSQPSNWSSGLSQNIKIAPT